jgi:hypothetical protein
MEAVIISQKNFDLVQQDLNEIKTYMKNITSPVEHFIDNDAFIELMRISSRTAQNWRDDGKIGFSKEGQKIYYRMSDIEKFLEHHHRKPFAKPRNSFL